MQVTGGMGPRNIASSVGSRRPISPIVVMPWARSFSAVASPTPQSASTGSGSRNADSREDSMTSSPSGLAARLAILASTFVRATPTVTASPTRSRASRRSRSAI